jgi:hypothetical protein
MLPTLPPDLHHEVIKIAVFVLKPQGLADPEATIEHEQSRSVDSALAKPLRLE